MKKLTLDLTPAQAMPVFSTLLERVQLRFKMHRGRLSREDLCVQRVALGLAKLLGPDGEKCLFPALRWNAAQRAAWEKKSRRRRR